jgi:hypothetical protein
VADQARVQPYRRTEQRGLKKPTRPTRLKKMQDEQNHIDKRIAQFKKDILAAEHHERVLQKHFIDRPCSFFSENINDPDLEYKFRHEIADACSTNINDIIIIGSAKTGFSVKSKNLIKFDAATYPDGRPKKSDIDVAIIDRSYFDNITYEIFKFSRHFDDQWINSNWKKNRYYDDGRVQLFEKYTKYLAKGWCRPDYLPEAFLANWEILEKIKGWKECLSNRKISIGIYSSWKFFKFYHLDNFAQLKSQLELHVETDIK